MVKKQTAEPGLLSTLSELGKKPPKSASRSIERYLKCESQQNLCAIVAEAVDSTKHASLRPIEAPSSFLPPLA